MAAPLSIALELGLYVEFKRGIDYYVDNVVEALAGADARNRYLLFSYFFRDHARKAARLPHPPAANFGTLYRRFPESLVRALDLERGLPLVEKGLLAGRGFDVYHVLAGGRLPHVRGAKTVVTFFDLAPEAFPVDGSAPDPGRKISSPSTWDTARRADRLVATGDYTKNDLIRYYGLPEEKIAVIPTGVNLKVFREPSAEERARARARYALPESYFMVIGPFVPPRRTNAESTVRAFAALNRAGRLAGRRLVFVGARNAHLEGLLALAAELGVGELCAATGYAALEDLPALYALSDGVVHPTSVEGFGYGLEVLACGAPFLTSDLPGVLESVGDAALAVTPNDVPALVEAMGALIEEPALRAGLRAKGPARAARYSYARIAERLVALYESLGRGGR